MTAAEHLLVSCLKRGDYKILSLIQQRWMEGEEVKQYRFVMDYYREYGEMVDLKTFCDKFHLASSESKARPSFYLNEVKERYIFATLSDKVPTILRGLKKDPRSSLTDLQKMLMGLSVDTVESKDTLYSDDVEERKKEYQDRLRTLGVTHLSMGAEFLDKTFYGYRKQDLITIGGKAGQGKSWLLVYLAHLLERVIQKMDSLGDRRGDILLITNEMGEEEIKERLDCIKYLLPYESFLRGTLSKREERRYFKGLEELKKVKSRIRIVYSCDTIDELTTLIGLYQPSAVFIDGSYLMEGQLAEGWEKIVYITRNLKRLCKSTKTPIINTTQLKRGSGKVGKGTSLDGQDEFAYSNSYAQDSDIAMRMFQNPDMRYHDMIGLEVVKGRRIKTGTILHFQNDLLNMCQSITIPEDESKADEIYTEI